MALDLWLPTGVAWWPLTGGLALGWVAAPAGLRWLAPTETDLPLGERAVALLSPLAAAEQSLSTVVVSEVALVFEPRGPLALAANRRPDELGDIELDARDVSQATVALAEILRRQHFAAGGTWRATTEPRDAPARLVEGDATLSLLLEADAAAQERVRAEIRAGKTRQPDDTDSDDAPPVSGGHVEDLVRAWFVLTGLPWVQGALVAPAHAAGSAELQAVVECLQASVAAVRARRDEVRRAAADRLGLPVETVAELFRHARTALGTRERESLARFWQRANVAAERTPRVVSGIASDRPRP